MENNKYILVQWPDSQAIMDQAFFNRCLLVTDIEGHEEVGSSAYMVPESDYNKWQEQSKTVAIEAAIRQCVKAFVKYAYTKGCDTPEKFVTMYEKDFKSLTKQQKTLVYGNLNTEADTKMSFKNIVNITAIGIPLIQYGVKYLLDNTRLEFGVSVPKFQALFKELKK